MENVFGKIQCPSCHQYKLQPTALGLMYVGLFFIIISSFSRYLPFNIPEGGLLLISGMGSVSIFIYLILLFTHKMSYVCKNCGKTSSYSEVQNLAKKQQVGTSSSFKSFLTRFAIFFFVALIAAGGYIYFRVGSGFQSTVKIAQDVPNGNVHWDKAQSLFQQIRNEKDIEKVKQLDAEIVTELKAVLAEQPNNPRVWYELGSAYSWISLLGGDPEVQLAAYQKAESLEPNNFMYINGVGDQLISMERYNDAILELQKAVRVGPNSFTYLSLAQAYRGAKIYDLAKQNYQKAIDNFSSHNDGGKWDAQILQAQQEMASLPK